MQPAASVVDFDRFLVMWNQAQRQTTPDVHLKMARWLQARWEAGDKRLLLMAFRSCGKSTIVGVFVAWLLYRDANLRILVLAAEGSLARRMVRNVRRIVERHSLTKHLKPANADQWAGDRFTVNRRLELRDPSVAGRGMDSNVTGSRADIVICDDVEVPKTCDTAERRAQLREKLGEIEFVLSAGGTILYVGTPHSWYTIYAKEIRAEIGEIQPFLQGYERLEIPLLNGKGRSAWPERYSLEAIAEMRRYTGTHRFSSQMLLVPTNLQDGRLNPALLKRYGGEPDYTKELKMMTMNGRRLEHCCAFWDPAVGGGDSSVVAIIFVDDRGDLWLHRVMYVRAGSNVDQGEMQVHQVATLLELNRVPSITIETNGVGHLFPQMLRRELVDRRIGCAVLGRPTTEPKNDRILMAFDTVMQAGMLHVHDTVYNTPFIREMQEWTPKNKHGKDDGLDAVASAIGLRPPKIKTGFFAGRQDWHGSGVQMAKTEFDV